MKKENHSPELDKKYCIKEDFILREMAGEYVVVPVDQEHSLANAMMIPNDTAVFIWKAFQKPCTILEAAEKAIEEYDADFDMIKHTVLRFVEESLAYGIIKEA